MEWIFEVSGISLFFNNNNNTRPKRLHRGAFCILHLFGHSTIRITLELVYYDLVSPSRLALTGMLVFWDHDVWFGRK